MERLYNFLKRNLNITKSKLNEVIKEVRVNNETCALSKFITSSDIITYKGQVLTNFNEKHLLLYNKPVGVEVTNNLANKSSYLHELNLDYRVFSLGRLDKDSHGLMILTNDSSFYKLMGDYEKEYIVRVNKAISDTDLVKLTKGVIIDKDYLTKACKTSRISSDTFKIILREGKNRQIRKMCKKLGYIVIDLERIRIDSYYLDNLALNEVKEIDFTSNYDKLNVTKK